MLPQGHGDKRCQLAIDQLAIDKDATERDGRIR